MGSNCLILGAGAVGKAVAGYIFSQMGCRIVFSDILPAVIDDLNARMGYRVYENETDYTEVRSVDAFLISCTQRMSDEVTRADYIVTSVGPEGFARLIRLIGSVLCQSANTGKPVVFFFFENIRNSAAIAGECLSGFEIGRPFSLVPVSIDRISSGYCRGGAFDVIAESFIPVCVPADGIKDGLFSRFPQFIHLVDNLDAYYYRKLFTANMGHAVLAYAGSLYKCTTIIEALEVPEVRNILRGALEESSYALVREYGFTEGEMDAFVVSLLEKRYPNRGLNDPLERLARDPIRKLGRNDRLTGAALLCLKHGLEPRSIIQAMTYAMRYEHPADKSSLDLAALLRKKGKACVLRKICGLQENELLYNLLMEQG